VRALALAWGTSGYRGLGGRRFAAFIHRNDRSFPPSSRRSPSNDFPSVPGSRRVQRTPYLRSVALCTRKKTRALLTLRFLFPTPIFARARLPPFPPPPRSSTCSTAFGGRDPDEADLFSGFRDATSSGTDFKILNMGTWSGLPCPRPNDNRRRNLSPTASSSFCPKSLAFAMASLSRRLKAASSSPKRTGGLVASVPTSRFISSTGVAQVTRCTWRYATGSWLALQRSISVGPDPSRLN